MNKYKRFQELHERMANSARKSAKNNYGKVRIKHLIEEAYHKEIWHVQHEKGRLLTPKESSALYLEIKKKFE